MAGLGKRIKRRLKDKKNQEARERMEILTDKMEELVRQEEYSQAMDIMAELCQNGRVTGRHMYLSAICYFFTGDMERAERWINNAFSKGLGKEYKGAIALLILLCLENDKEKEAISLWERYLEITIEENDFFVEGVIADIEKIALSWQVDREEYPKVSAWQIAKGAKEEEQEEEEDREDKLFEDIDDLLAISHEAEVAEADEPLEAEQSGEELTEVREILAKLDQEKISLTKKVKILNAFAGAFFQRGDFAGAEALLREALEIDNENEQTIRNLAYNFLAAGKIEEAGEMAAQLENTDFALLWQLGRA